MASPSPQPPPPAHAPVNYVYLPPGQAAPPGATVYVVQAPAGAPVPNYAPPPTFAPAVYAPPPQGYTVAVQPTPNVVYAPAVQGGKSYAGMARAAMTLYIIAYAAGIYPCAIISLAMSLHLVRVKVIPEKWRPHVIAFSVLELIGCAVMAGLSWLVFCYEEPYQYEDCYGNCEEYTEYIYECEWDGWIAIIIWYALALPFGIPRIVYTYKSRNNLAPSSGSGYALTSPQPAVYAPSPQVIYTTA